MSDKLKSLKQWFNRKEFAGDEFKKEIVEAEPKTPIEKTRHLITIISTHGKDSEQVAEEAFQDFQKYQEGRLKKDAPTSRRYLGDKIT